MLPKHWDMTWFIYPTQGFSLLFGKRQLWDLHRFYFKPSGLPWTYLRYGSQRGKRSEPGGLATVSRWLTAKTPK